MSRDFDPETDPFQSTDTPGGDVERPGHQGTDDPIPVPPTEPPPSPIEEPPDSPNVPDDPNPTPIGDPDPIDLPQIV